MKVKSIKTKVSKNKKTIVVGALALTGLYLVMGNSEDGAAFGGGFGGGLPAIAEAAGEAAEAGGDIIINYPDVEDPFTNGGEPETETEPDAEVDVKKPDAIEPEKLNLLGEPMGEGGFFEKPDDPITSTSAGEFVRGGIIGAGKLALIGTAGGLDFIGGIAGLDLGLQEGMEEATEGLLAPTGKEPMGFGGEWDTDPAFKPSTPRSISDVMADYRKQTKKDTVRTDPGYDVQTLIKNIKYRDTKKTSAQRGYSLMAAGTAHAPGWKQIGAQQPTAPGQPDVYSG